MITIDTKPFAIELSTNAYETLKGAGMAKAEHVQKDIDALVNGKTTAKKLLAYCLKGAESADVEAGWEEYVGAVETAAAR